MRWITITYMHKQEEIKALLLPSIMEYRTMATTKGRQGSADVMLSVETSRVLSLEPKAGGLPLGARRAHTEAAVNLVDTPVDVSKKVYRR